MANGAFDLPQCLTHIRAQVDIQLSNWMPGLLARASLGRAREALLDSISPDPPEHRKESRLTGLRPERRGQIVQGRQVVLNISRMGMAIQGTSQCRFARGEIHRFTLAVGVDTLDVEGKVCWTESEWRYRPSHVDPIYHQTAGFDLAEALKGDALEIWEILRSMVKACPVRIRVQSFQVVKQFR